MLSTVTRNSAASVVGALMWALLMQLLGVLPGTERASGSSPIAKARTS